MELEFGSQAPHDRQDWRKIAAMVGWFFEPRNIDGAYRQILTIAGLRHARAHDLTHTAATLFALTGSVSARCDGTARARPDCDHDEYVLARRAPALRKEAADKTDAALTPREPVATSVVTKQLTERPN